jgi:hypothetical protein
MLREDDDRHLVSGERSRLQREPGAQRAGAEMVARDAA